ncbi:MAG TPA: PD-(D/E)XK nuclease family protein, partial [Xanthomonadaceae bacterium]|nr:PD-(D/E)XK nuclease family protein [Xanthomonadaceae bacterium]
QLPGDEAPADDERPLAAFATAPSRFGGARFGNALHQALEHTDFARWRDLTAGAIPAGEDATLRKALADHGYGAGDLDEGVRELASLVARTLAADLPCGRARVRLCELPAAARVPEIEFHYTLADADGAALLALLHAHGIARERRDFGAWPRLSGLMNGKIDLTFAVDGQVHVLDYKSNRLPAYDPSTLREAMAASEYDLQALLYAVAVHRWLRVRRGADYAYARDFGGVHYLFCRGLDPAQPGHGVVTLELPAALVEGVDALFGAAGGDA